MSIDPKAFGLSNSLVSAVNEALKGGQKKLDKNHNGKLDSQDFKMLRKEESEQVDERNTENKAKKNAAVAAVGSKHKDSQYLNRVNPSVADKIRGREVLQGKNRQQHEETDPGFAEAAENPIAKQIAAKKDSMKAQIQQKIAAKQMNTMQAKANKRLSNIHASNDKCTCQEGKGKSMSCEVCNKESTKGGKEQIIVNPPMREAAELPKKVITKGHEIAKSLIKHKSKVDNPYAVGMATAKKSAGVKEEVEQVDEKKKQYKPDELTKSRNPLVYGDKKKSNPLVYRDKHRDNPLVYGKKKTTKEEFEQVDELSRKTLISYGVKTDNQLHKVNAVGIGTKKSGIPGHYRGKNKELGKDPAHKVRMRKAGNDLAWDKASKMRKEEVEQVDEVLDSPIKKLAYVMKAKKSIEKSDPKKIKQANAIANRVIGIKRVMNKMNKKD